MTPQERVNTAAQKLDAYIAELEQEYGVQLQMTLTYIQGLEGQPIAGRQFAAIRDWQKPAQADLPTPNGAKEKAKA